MRTLMRRAAILGLLLLVLPAGPACRAGMEPPAAGHATAPTQPADGPGGAKYTHGGVATRHIGEGDRECWIFTPADPTPPEAPVVVFLHGWGGMKPGVYGAWIRHLVRRGHIVIYPRYQGGLRDKPDDMIQHAFASVQAAWKSLSSEGGTRPRTDKIAYIGHSLGGILAANLAARGSGLGLPPTGAVLMAEPSNGSPWIKREERVMRIDDVSRIPAEALVVALVGEADRLASDFAAKKILAGMEQVPRQNKNFLMVRSDSHTSPPLQADHLSPTCPDASITDEHEDTADDDDLIDLLGENNHDPSGPELQRGNRRGTLRQRIAERRAQRGGATGPARADRKPTTDALDWYGYWRVADGLLDACFEGRNREFALGDGPEVRRMGTCSDGTPVTPLEVRPLP